MKQDNDNNEKTNSLEQLDAIDNSQNESLLSHQMSPQIIGQIKEEKQKSVVGVIIIFIILIGFTFGLPQITKYYNKKTTSEEKTLIEEEKNQNEDKPIEAEEPVYYEINANTEFTVDNLHFSTITKEQTDDYYLRMTIENRSNKVFDFSIKYYIELYNGDKTLLERVKLVNSVVISSNNSISIDLPISQNSYNNASLLSISTKSIEDYQEVSLSTKEKDFDLLTCTNKTRSITYYFKEDKLAQISDVYEYSNADNSTYTTILKTYTNQAAKYNNIEGVASNIVDTTQSFTMNTQIDLEKADISSLQNNYYFKKGTLPKVVKFEMESMRYTCK